MCGGMAVAAHDRHPRLRDALFGPDDVDDALAGIVEAVEGDYLLLAVGDECVDLSLGQRIANSQAPLCGGNAMVDGGQGQVGPAHGSPCQAQGFEGLGGGHLVNQVEIDVKEIGLAGSRIHDVVVPHLFEQGPCRHGTSFPRARSPGKPSCRPGPGGRALNESQASSEAVMSGWRRGVDLAMITSAIMKARTRASAARRPRQPATEPIKAGPAMKAR